MLCGVCYTEVCPVNNPQGAINCCSHIFCAYCISQWAKETNVCPQCRARFNRITVVDHATGETTVTKIRRKNYKGWEAEGTDSADSDDEEMLAARRASRAVNCSICKSSESAITMLCCDRRTCSFIAHLECLGITEAPEAFVCPSCGGPPIAQSLPSAGLGRSTPQTPIIGFPAAGNSTTPVRWLMDDDDDDDAGATAVVVPIRVEGAPQAASSPSRAVKLETAVDDEHRRRAQPTRAAPAAPAARRQPHPSSSHVAAAPAVMAPPPAAADDDVPYWLRPPEHVQEPLDLLRRRKERTAYAQKVREERQADATRKRPRESQEAPAARSERMQQQQARPAAMSTEDLASLERTIINAEFQSTLNVLRQRQAVERAALHLDFGGNIIAKRPLAQAEKIAREDELRTEAMKSARDVASRHVNAIATAQHDAVKRALERSARREALALAKLAQIIAAKRKLERPLGSAPPPVEDAKPPTIRKK